MTRTFQRGLAVLEIIASSPSPLGIQRVASLTGLDKATAMRMLQTLCGAGYLYQDTKTKAFAMTDKLQRLAVGAAVYQDLCDLSRPCMTELRDSLEETVHLGVLRNDRIVYIDKLESRRSVRLVSSVGQEMPLHCTALGKAILAALPDMERKAIIHRLPLERRTPRSIISLPVLNRELTIARNKGWAIDREENEDNVTCVGSAVLDARGHVLGAISVSGPSFRMTARVKEIVTAIRRVIAKIGVRVRPRS
jgi:DNA-binding IclR family transcriptional regulator